MLSFAKICGVRIKRCKKVFPNLFLLVVDKDGWVSDAWEEGGELVCWSPRFSRRLNDWKMGEVESVSEASFFGC